MRTQKLDGGGIAIIATNEERHELAERYRSGKQDGYANSGYKYAEEYVHECLHEQLDAVQPEWVGALTDSPMYSESAYIADDGEPEVSNPVYWYPDYQITDPYRVLANCGRVVFN